MTETDLLPIAKQHHKAGQLSEAETLYKRVLEGEPENPEALHLLGVVALQCGQSEAAVDLIRRALSLRPGSAQAHNNLGAALKALGRFEEADSEFESAIGLDPAFADAHYNHATALHATGKLDAAIDAYRSAITLQPSLAEARLMLGAALLGSGRPEEAAAALNESIQTQPTLAEAHAELGNALRRLGRLDEAERAYVRATELKPELIEAQQRLCELLFEREDPRALLAQYNVGAALLRRGDARGALKALDANLRAGLHNTRELALKAVAHLQLGETQAARGLLDFDRFVGTTEIQAPSGFASLESFNEALAAHVRTHPTLTREPEGRTTRLGKQSGELLDGSPGPIATLEGVIRDALGVYRDRRSAGPSHPFLSRLPTEVRLSIWGVVMDGCGHQESHVHPDGWLSGVYYVRVPGGLSAASGEGETRQAHPGCLELGRPDPRLFDLSAEPPTFVLTPEAGTMVLFPSYFYHRTLPFETEGERISIAFDVVPLVAES